MTEELDIRDCDIKDLQPRRGGTICSVQEITSASLHGDRRCLFVYCGVDNLTYYTNTSIHGEAADGSVNDIIRRPTKRFYLKSLEILVKTGCEIKGSPLTFKILINGDWYSFGYNNCGGVIFDDPHSNVKYSKEFFETCCVMKEE